jgi:DNA primase
LRDFELKKRQILDRVDILDLVSEHVSLKRSGRRWVGLCPFHTEKTPSFTVSPEYGSFKCFGCGKSGDSFSFVQFRENVTFAEAMGLLADRVGVELGSGHCDESAGPARTDLVKVTAWAARYFRAQLLDKAIGREAQEYLRGRHISDATAEQFGLGLAIQDVSGLSNAAARAGIDRAMLLATDLMRQGDSGRCYDTFRNRLMFPIADATGRVVGFGGRTLGDDRAKYLNTAQNALFDKGKSLYGLPAARQGIAERGRVIVVEGYMDCLAAHQAGFTETVAALGTALTETQVDVLRRHCDQMILLFDSDEAGEAAAERAIHVALPRCVTVRLAHVPGGEDPSDFLSHAGKEKFSDLLNRAVDALEFKWLRTQERFRGMGSDQRRRDAVLEMLRLVAEAADTRAVDTIQRGLLVNQVAHLLQMDRREVDDTMRRLRRKRTYVSAPPGTGVVESPRRVPPDSEQAAWTHLLEVLLNEPALWSVLDEPLDANRIADAQDRRIATVVFELAGQTGEFSPTDVSARFQEPECVARVMELVERGARRGNYENTLRLALERIRSALRNEEVERSRQEWGHRAYVPRRFSRPTGVGGDDAGP